MTTPRALLNSAIYDIEDQGYTREPYVDIDRENTENFINILLKYDIILQQNETHYSRSLIYFPDLLEKFICHLHKHNIKLTDYDVISILNWYVENVRGTVPEEIYDIVLKYYPDPKELTLLPFRWKIDNQRYQKLTAYGFYSCGIKNANGTIKYQTFLKNYSGYPGYRYTLYLLSYGSQDDINYFFSNNDCTDNCRSDGLNDYIKYIKSGVLSNTELRLSHLYHIKTE